MSHEPIEIVRAHTEAYLRDPQGALSFLDPNVVLDTKRLAPLVGVACGLEAVAETVARYVGAFDDYGYEVEGLTDLGSGAILADVTETGRGKESGAPVRQSFAVLYTVIDGKIARITHFPSELEARRAAGMGV